MDETSPEAAQALYQKGCDLKKAGDPDGALTEFRRAVLADPTHQPSYLAIGQICKTKAFDPVFARHAFEAFRRAARLNPTDQEAHDQYILMGQKVGRLDELHTEYEAWAKQHPENELFKRCARNILTISMAMIPAQTKVGSAGASPMMRKAVFFVSIVLVLVGIGLILGPVLLSKSGKTLQPGQAKSLLVLGILVLFGGVAGFIGSRRLT